MADARWFLVLFLGALALLSVAAGEDLNSRALKLIFDNEGGCQCRSDDEGNKYGGRIGCTCMGVTPADGWGARKMYSGCESCKEAYLFPKCCYNKIGQAKFREFTEKHFVADYFGPGKCTGLAWPAFYVCADVSVLEGTGAAASYVSQTSSIKDAKQRCQRINALSKAHYQRIGGPNLPGWMNRASRRESECIKAPAPPPAPTPKPKPDPGKPCAQSTNDILTGNSIIKTGCRTPAVAAIGRLFGITATSWDGRIVDAVKRFQKVHGLKAPPGEEGWVGKTTWEWIQKISKQSVAKFNLPCAKNVNDLLSEKGILRPGCSGDLVVAVEKLLKFPNGDKSFSDKLRDAVIEFQRQKKLSPPVGEEGWVGATTYKALDPKAKPPGPAPSPSHHSSASPSPPAPPGGCAIGKWPEVLKTKTIVLYNFHTSGNGKGDGADAKAEATDAAVGKKVKRSHYGTAPGGTVCLSTKSAELLLAVAKKGKITVSELAGGSHSEGSLHYSGVAVDIDTWNGSIISRNNAGAPIIIAACRSLGARHIFHSSLNCGDVCAEHNDHVHCDF